MPTCSGTIALPKVKNETSSDFAHMLTADTEENAPREYGMFPLIDCTSSKNEYLKISPNSANMHSKANP